METKYLGCIVDGQAADVRQVVLEMEQEHGEGESRFYKTSQQTLTYGSFICPSIRPSCLPSDWRSELKPQIFTFLHLIFVFDLSLTEILTGEHKLDQWQPV